MLKEVEDVELVLEEEMYRLEFDIGIEEELSIDIEDGVYVVIGKVFRRIMYFVNFDDMEFF